MNAVIRNLRVIPAALILFAAGIMCSGIIRVPGDTLGVKQSLWCDDSPVVLAPGIHPVFPLTHRTRVFPLSGVITFANTRLGNFNEMKAVEGMTSDGNMVTLHVTAAYGLSPETGTELLRKFRGEMPVPYFEYLIRENLERMISQTNAEYFAGAGLDQFISEAESRCMNSLITHGFHLESLEVSVFENHAPYIRTATDWDREKWAMIQPAPAQN
ncbi:MAG TPA: SPFH domain-containing protein [bacterium]|nr:SPFH domain-containing protein [bacterium]